MPTYWKYILATFCLMTIVVWFAVFTFPQKKLHIIACDVGQGDAILALYGSTQILIDGGPNDRVLGCLSKYLPFWDRKVELIILTHPEKDHFSGLIQVFKRYTVKNFLANSLDSGAQEYQVLKSVVGGSDTKVIYPTNSMSIRLGMIYLDIVFPTSEFIATETKQIASKENGSVLGTTISNRNTNDFSIVTILHFDNFEALLTGDIQPPVTDLVAEILMKKFPFDFDLIKIPHHGSKNGLTEKLLKTVKPEIAVISVGKNNSYGHPHEETLKLLKDQDVRILRTDERGDIELISDGKNIHIKN